jgi:hypothetical protein
MFWHHVFEQYLERISHSSLDGTFNNDEQFPPTTSVYQIDQEESILPLPAVSGKGFL